MCVRRGLACPNRLSASHFCSSQQDKVILIYFHTSILGTLTVSGLILICWLYCCLLLYEDFYGAGAWVNGSMGEIIHPAAYLRTLLLAWGPQRNPEVALHHNKICFLSTIFNSYSVLWTFRKLKLSKRERSWLQMQKVETTSSAVTSLIVRGRIANTNSVKTQIWWSIYRLNLQHYLWTQMFGYLLHPSIDIDKSQENLKVADIGTGTGWVETSPLVTCCQQDL